MKETKVYCDRCKSISHFDKHVYLSFEFDFGVNESFTFDVCMDCNKYFKGEIGKILNAFNAPAHGEDEPPPLRPREIVEMGEKK